MPDRTIPLAHFAADPPSVTFEPSNLTSAVLYELFTTIALYPHNAAIAREDVLQLQAAADRFVFIPAAATEHAATIVAEFNRKIIEFAAADPDYHSALIARAQARAGRGY
ncbi:MAG: hypothetical protein EKK51_31520 [Mycolicibacterium sp.]|uniref:hypothetical protein n=1 Tax=Mycolicibacterium sp. TaxID=2320850 RepID=UPI000F92DCCA|nr:hypothetical protein [Mycolicibacterium sp.]RUP25859.1 MAG: hypothetical protein EKK51_31520 [Mycolicibacterium sp.]